MSSKASQVPPGLAQFIRLNDSIWYHETPTAKPASSSKEPDLVLLLGWMDATARHISKYTAEYKILYPTSRILAITTTALDETFRTEAANIARLGPALEILYALPPDAKVLLHFFSNGGALVACMITKHFREKEGRILPVSAVVADSAPGKAEFQTNVNAFVVGLTKNPLANIVGQLLVRAFIGWYYAWCWGLGIPHLEEDLRKGLNDKKYMEIKAPRVYIYSDVDDMVQWYAVEEHAAEAKELGWRVDTEKFEGSAHAAHMPLDRDRYWKTVQKVWDSIA